MSADNMEKATKNTIPATASNLKYLSLAVLVLQNAGVILTIRYSRTLPGDMYIASTAVVFTEIFKLITCLGLTFFEIKDFGKWLRYLHANIIADPWATVKVAVPSFIYVIQNNLQYIAISNLDAATFQVTYQLKILTTALFSVILLHKRLSRLQCGSLVLLFLGIILVQLQPSQLVTNTGTGQSPFIGLTAVVVSSLCSGFAGVYFEKILKGSGTQGASIWLRNIQLGLFGMVLGAFGMVINDGQKIKEKGLFFGYTNIVWIVILMQVFGGLLVAVVAKYADMILKGFATSVAIIVSCVVSIFLFKFVISVQFLVGTAFVMTAVYLYGRPQATTVAK